MIVFAYVLTFRWRLLYGYETRLSIGEIVAEFPA
jgi:hypothetical protein